MGGNYGMVGGYEGYPGNIQGGPIVNEGIAIRADVGGTITLLGTGWQNAGTLLATNGGTLNLEGSGTSTGMRCHGRGHTHCKRNWVTNTGRHH